MHSIAEADVNGKKVIVRADLDLAENNGQFETFRLQRLLPTLKSIRQQGGTIRIIAHRGRPEGVDPNLSLAPVAALLTEQLGQEVSFGGDLLVNPNPTGEIVLFENLRFNRGEEANSTDFTDSLAQLGEIYVNESFATSHRDHASIVSLPKLLPHFAGLNLLEEIKNLSKVIESPEHPLVVIVGGIKVETKRPLLDYMQNIADYILVGSSLMKDLVATAKIIVPSDTIGDGQDIGVATVAHFTQVISSAKMIVWNGPLGKYEDNRFAGGTKAIAQAIVATNAYSVVGGGDTIASLDEMGLISRVSFVSTGGGAMLEFLSGKKLPGIEALQ